MKIALILITIISSFLFLSCTEDFDPVNDSLTFKKTFGGSFKDIGFCVKPTTDGGCIITGSHKLNLLDSSKVWLIKTDFNGTEEWNNTFGGLENDEGRSVSETADGGYIIIGTTESYGAGYSDIYLIKTDITGNEIWSKTFGETESDYGRFVQQTSDGGFIITGYKGGINIGWWDLWLIKTDSLGNEEWNRTFGGSDIDYGEFVVQTSDSGYIITGVTRSYGAGNRDTWLIKTDSLGNELWSNTYGTSSEEMGTSVKQTSDGGYIICGAAYNYTTEETKVLLLKVDTNGNESFYKVINGTGYDFAYDVSEITQGGFIITGASRIDGYSESDLLLAKTDELGNVEWYKSYGGSSDDEGQSLFECSDGGYIITGSTKSYGSGSSDVWLLRTNEDGVIE